MTARPSRQARTVFIGTGSFGVEALEMLAAAGHGDPTELVGVVTSPGRPAGRTGEIRPSPIEVAATALGIQPILALPRLRPPEAAAAVLALQPDLVVLADDGRLVPPPLLAVRDGALNLHPSLLPRHRGATPIPATILAGDVETGVTIIRMDEGIDSGPIVAVERIRLEGTESAPALEVTLSRLAAGLLRRTRGPWLRGEIVPAAQDDGTATLTRLLRREDGRLDPQQPVATLERRVRALQPWPGTWLRTAAGRIIVHEAAVAPAEPGDVPGRVVAHAAGLALVAADGRLVIGSVQAEGGRRMTGAELRRGRPGLVGLAVE